MIRILKQPKGIYMMSLSKPSPLDIQVSSNRAYTFCKYIQGKR